MTSGGNSFNVLTVFPKLYQPEKSQPNREDFSFSRTVAVGLFLEWAYNAAASITPTLIRYLVVRIRRGGSRQLQQLPAKGTGTTNKSVFSLDNMALPAFAAARHRCCWAPAPIDISFPDGAQQQTRRTPLLRSNDGADGYLTVT